MKEGQRRSFYFNEQNADLIEFIESQEINANKFVIQLIRVAKENQEFNGIKEFTKALETSTDELNSLAIELKSVLASEKQKNPNEGSSSLKAEYGLPSKARNYVGSEVL